jgi:hypothetical protein
MSIKATVEHEDANTLDFSDIFDGEDTDLMTVDEIYYYMSMCSNNTNKNHE